MKNISVVGAGKLGLSMAAIFASKNYNVICVDINTKVIEIINQGKSSIYETGIDEIISNNRTRLLATENFQDAIDNSDITFIVVNTPSKVNGSYSLQHLSDVAKKIGQSIKKKTKYHIIVVSSTVLPNNIRKVIKPIIEKYSGKRCSSDFGLCYNPEFIALGSILHDFQHPDFVLIGESDDMAGRMLSNIYKKVCGKNVKIARMSIENAELAKIALNSFITMKISYANTLTEICEKLEGGNIDVITKAIGLDQRISPRYLKGGLAFGGPCFPRDNKAIEYFAREMGCQAKIPHVVDYVNNHQIRRIIDLISKYNHDKIIAILGLSYKPNTNIVEESAALKITTGLLDVGFKVNVYDPVALSNVKEYLQNKKVFYANSMKLCISNADIIIIATPWDEFKDLKQKDFKKVNEIVLLDCWRILDRKRFNSKIKYIGLGLNTQQEK